MACVPEAALRALSVGTRTVIPAQSSPEFVTRKSEERGAGPLPSPSPRMPEDISHITRPSAQQPNGIPLSGVRRVAHMRCGDPVVELGRN